MKEKLLHEIRSFLVTFLAIFSVEAYVQLVQIYNADWTTAALQALGFAALRSAIKALLQLIYPVQFPPQITITTTSTNIPITLTKK